MMLSYLMVVFLFTAPSALVAVTPGVCSPAAYSVFLNVDGDYAKLIAPFGIFPNTTVQTGNGCTNPGCKSWAQGAWPMLSVNGTVLRNGGVPQRMNLTLHLERLKEDVQTWAPDPDWSGNGVFDFEAFTPVWEQNDGTGTWHSVQYQRVSEDLIRKEHPTWTNVTAAAKAEFEKAALTLFVETINTVKALRPKAKWGFYGMPQYFNPMTPSQNNRVKALWQASTALYPSIYLPPGLLPAENRMLTSLNIKEAQRCAGNQIPVRPFMWSYYHKGNHTLSPEDLHTSVTMPQELGCDGLVIWGSPVHRGKLEEFEAYLTASLGPASLSSMKTACECAQSQCSGHGRCVPDGCQCYSGHSGDKCQNYELF